MPKRTDIKSIAIIGAGPIVIGQACEFDYSGAQACKALREEGYRVILINSNPATIMTDPDLADATYIEPITPDTVLKILELEKPDAILPTMGGQTALNTALALAESGDLDRLGIELIGAKKEAIQKAEDRLLFRDAMDKIGLNSPKSKAIHTLQEARDYLPEIGLPAIIRPSFTLGGTGGGIAYNKQQFDEIVMSGLAASPTTEVLVEESVLGWKEFEMEVVRDKADNSIIICSIENFDPMGVHTGDSITVAPALTLTDKEYQIMRNASIAVLREIGVETGGSNVQFAVNPKDGRMVVIEMNPRVSRSSALASKATGFPIAKIAAKLAVGYTLDELKNDITKTTPASFEPSIDYVVTKIPRFAFEKFKGADNNLTTSMKSVGEVMAIGRTFEESLQKALRGLETGLDGFNDVALGDDPNQVLAALSKATPDRILAVAQAFRQGLTVDQIHRASAIDPWFLERIKNIIDTEQTIIKNGLPQTKQQWRDVKAMGFSDARIAKLVKEIKFSEEEIKPKTLTKPISDLDKLSNEMDALSSSLKSMALTALAATNLQLEDKVRKARQFFGVRPVYKRIDTCAAEFPSETSYFYSTYEGGLNEPVCESRPTDKKKIVILGGGPNRIGQGIEFDYCCVHAAYALRDAGFETIMVNCNPETVSTDYDTSDRLYFEPLTAEDVVSLIQVEQQKGEVLGVIVQLGGQTPLKLAQSLEEAGIPILGTSRDAIDLAEDRERFQQLLHKLNLKQPPNGLARSAEEAEKIAEEIGYPLVIRPSYVLGGRGMEIVHDTNALRRYISTAVQVSGDNPVLLDRYLNDAIEVDVDALCDGKDVYVAGIMEHIEEAGVHSGDSACALPPYSLSQKIVDQIHQQTEKMAVALQVVGLMNVQFAVKGDDIYVLEVNPRASRTSPFVAKATGIPIIKIASRLMAGEKLATFNLKPPRHTHYAVKEAVFPFNRFPGVDVILSPEMKSTGEVMGLDVSFPLAFAKAQLGAGVRLPKTGKVFVSVRDTDKPRIPDAIRTLEGLGFTICATAGTAEFLQKQGIKAEPIRKVLEGSPHILDEMQNGDIHLVINTTEGAQSISDSFSLRRTALMNNIPYYTTLSGAKAAIEAIKALKGDAGLTVQRLQTYHQEVLAPQDGDKDLRRSA